MKGREIGWIITMIDRGFRWKDLGIDTRISGVSFGMEANLPRGTLEKFFPYMPEINHNLYVDMNDVEEFRALLYEVTP